MTSTGGEDPHHHRTAAEDHRGRQGLRGRTDGTRTGEEGGEFVSEEEEENNKTENQQEKQKKNLTMKTQR